MKQYLKIYYLNRYDLYETENYRAYSGYEQVVKSSSVFYRIKKHAFLQKLLKKFIFKSLPKDYLAANLSKEIIAFFKVLFTKSPVFYLYADKDAYILPILKRKLGLKCIKLYGTLHWPPEISSEFSFYKNNLITEFNGIIGLSTTISNLDFKPLKVIPHGIDLQYWSPVDDIITENVYLIIGVSNRDHNMQQKVINTIKGIDENAKFIVVAKTKAVRKLYADIEQVQTITFLTDSELKRYYTLSKAVILFQHHCLASNVVLESIAMCVPIITNLVGDINEYLGNDYPMYLDDDNLEEQLMLFCFNESLQHEIKNRFKAIREQFAWPRLTQETIEFIKNNY